MMAASVKRNTTIVQKLEINIDLGELPPNKHLETVRVQRKLDGAKILVNRKDHAVGKKFPPTEFIEIEALDPDEGIDLAHAPTQREETSLYSDDELARMTIKQLRALPEFTRIPDGDRRKLRKKDDYISALLAVRNPSVGLPNERIAL